MFDTEETRDLVKSVVDWFKTYRDILESDFIHGRRADGRELDWILHVNPRLDEKGMLCVYNPLDQDVTRTLRVNLYYTGLTDAAHVSANGQDAFRMQSRSKLHRRNPSHCSGRRNELVRDSRQVGANALFTVRPLLCARGLLRLELFQRHDVIAV